MKAALYIVGIVACLGTITYFVGIPHPIPAEQIGHKNGTGKDGNRGGGIGSTIGRAGKVHWDF